jgi:hypothetical protein
MSAIAEGMIDMRWTFAVIQDGISEARPASFLSIWLLGFIGLRSNLPIQVKRCRWPVSNARRGYRMRRMSAPKTMKVPLKVWKLQRDVKIAIQFFNNEKKWRLKIVVTDDDSSVRKDIDSFLPRKDQCRLND